MILEGGDEGDIGMLDKEDYEAVERKEECYEVSQKKLEYSDSEDEEYRPDAGELRVLKTARGMFVLQTRMTPISARRQVAAARPWSRTATRNWVSFRQRSSSACNTRRTILYGSSSTRLPVVM